MIENYYNLLFAIMNSDSYSDNKYEYPIIVYDIKTDLPIAVFKNSNTCAQFFNTTSNVIRSTICKKHNIRARYRLERIKEV